MTILKFAEPPSDTITDIFIDNEKIYVSSWDCNIHVYNLYTQKLLFKIENEFPICKMLNTKNLIYADTEGFVNFYNMDNSQQKKINFNFEGISSLEYQNKMLLIGGYVKKLIIFYDDGKSDFVCLDNKVYESILENNNLILNHGNKIVIYDIRNFNKITEIYNKHFIRSICIKSNKIYIGDVYGKLKIYNTITKEEIVVNAHYEILENIKNVYPINSIIYDDYLYTCGSDGIVNRWKEENKVKCKKIFKNNTGILKMSSYNTKIVIGCGYNYEKGPKNDFNNNLFML